MKRVAIWIIIISCGALSINLARSVYDLTQREHVVQDARDTLASVQQEHEQLQKELEYVKSPAYVEQQARDTLNLARPNETVIILPEITPSEVESDVENDPIWKQWLIVFGFM